MEEKSMKSLSERAMYYGTIFGGIMVAANIFYLLGLSSSTFSTLFLLLTLSSPFIAGKLAVYYRKSEQENQMTFIQAWHFLIIMYICAALLTAIAQFIYFTFMDNGYFMSTILQQFDTFASMEDIDATLRKELTTTADLLRSIGNRDIVLQIFCTNVIISPIITFFIAIFVRRNA